MAQFLAQYDNAQLLGFGVTIMLVVVTLAIFYFANKAESADALGHQMKEAYEEEEDSSSLMNSDSDCVIGSTDKYEWSQGDAEMEVFINLSSYGSQRLRAKDMAVTIKPNSLKVVIGGEVVVDGQLHGRVLADDSCWLIDEIQTKHLIPTPSSNPQDKATAYAKPPPSTQQVLWITLLKAQAGDRGSYWPGLIKGHEEVRIPRPIQRMSSSPPVHTVDPTDTKAMLAAMKAALNK